jgi:hypothetical protein
METSTGAAVTVTMFKSRNRKSSNIRSSSNSNTNDDDDNDNDGSNSGVLQNAQELKLEQQMRKRKMGVDPVDAIKANRHHEYQRQNELHKQFNSTNNDANISLADGIAHEKLMEQYVEEKLGLKHLKGSNNNSNGTTTTTSIEDELYRVPDLLKSLTSSTSRNDKISDNIGLTSVVEVNLPSTYKLRNIRETEVAIKSSQGNVTVSKIKTMPHSRFENHYDSTVVDLDLDAIKNEKKGSITTTTNTVSSFAMREEDKISFEVESSEATVTS